MTGYLIKRLITSEYLSLVLRVYLGYFFIYASLSKIPHPAQFAEAIANYRLIPHIFVNSGAVILPWLEFVSGLFLIIGFRSRVSSVIIGLMLITFNFMILINMYRGTPITCGCYDTVGEPIGWGKVLENSLMLLSAVHIYLFDRQALPERQSVFSTQKVLTPRTYLRRDRHEQGPRPAASGFIPSVLPVSRPGARLSD